MVSSSFPVSLSTIPMDLLAGLGPSLVSIRVLVVFLMAAVGSLASSIPRVFPDLGASSVSVVPSLVAMFGSLVLTVSEVSSAGVSLVLPSRSPQVHQVMRT